MYSKILNALNILISSDLFDTQFHYPSCNVYLLNGFCIIIIYNLIANKYIYREIFVLLK